MSAKRALASLVFLVACNGLVACGNSDSDPAVPSVNPDGSLSLPPRLPMTPEERVAALAEVTDVVDTVFPDASVPWAARDRVAELRAAAQKLVELSEVIGVSVSEPDETATVIFSDGTTATLINNKPMSSASAADDSVSSLSSTLTTPGVPPTKRAVVTSYDGGAAIEAEIRRRLTAADFDVRALGTSLDSMRQYQNLGVLYLDTHSGTHDLFDVTRDAAGQVTNLGYATDSAGNKLSRVYIYQTSTRVATSALRSFGDEIERRELALIITDSEEGSQAYIGITEKFIDRYWSFDNGVVILHSCYSGSGPFVPGEDCTGGCPVGSVAYDPDPLRDALLNAGANVAMTFDRGTWADQASPSMYYFLDRLLGTNQERPASPANRPFDWRSVQTAMAENRLTSFQLGNNTVNIVLVGDETPVSLAPSLEKVDVADDNDAATATATLHGWFGPEQGQVTLGSSTLDVVSWAEDEIVCQIPYNPTPGEVRVRSAADTPSNRVPITEWTGKISFTHVRDDALTSRTSIDVAFRSDVHAIRSAVDAEPKHRVSTAYISSNAVTGAVTATGAYTTMLGVEEIWSGGGGLEVYGKSIVDDLVAGNRPTAQGAGVSEFAGLVEIDPAQKKARLCLWIEGYYDVFLDGLIEPAEASFTSLSLVFWLADRTKGQLECFDADLDDNYNIQDGKSTYDIPGTFFELEWKDFQVRGAPDAATAG